MSDVAALAGVSAMTVSRALKNHPAVTVETKRRVLAAAEKLSYEPNEVARSLRERKSRQIGIIVPYLFDPFFANCAHIIGGVAKQHGYSVVLSTSDEDIEIEYREASRMLRRNVDGLVIIPAHAAGTNSRLIGPTFRRIPIVAIDRPLPKKHWDSFLVENEKGAGTGTEHLLRLGHRRIAYVGLTTTLYTMQQRQAGYTRVMRKADGRPEVLHLTGQAEAALPLVSKLFSGKNRATAVFCANNLVTRHVLHCLRIMKLRVPQEIALVGFDDFETADLIEPGITVVRQPVEQLAQNAAARLFSRLEKPSDSGGQVTLPVEIVVRGSCGTAVEARERG